MKIDFDMLEKQVAAGMTAQALLIYVRTQFDAWQAARAKKRPADARRTKARRERDKGVTQADASVIEADTPSKQAEREYYRIGKQILGKSAGGLLSSLLRHHGYDLSAARRALDEAATKQDPREYVSASMRTKANGQQSFEDRISDLAGEARRRERQAGIFRPDDPVGGH